MSGPKLNYPRDKVVSILFALLDGDLSEDEIFIEAPSAKGQNDLFLAFREELSILSKIDPEGALSVNVEKVFRLGKLWIRVSKAKNPFSSVLVKQKNGVKRVSWKED